MMDLHLHTTASDGTDSPAELVAKLSARGIRVAAITDHDTTDGIAYARAVLPEGIKLVDGVELSCIYAGPKKFRCHILGYGIDVDNEKIKTAIELGRQKRKEKQTKRLEYLKDSFNIIFTDEELAELDSYDSVGKLHLAKLIVERGLADDISCAIDEYLSGYTLPDDRIEASLAISAIKAAGGVPVWAHPLGGEREKRIDEKELFRRLNILKAMGLMGLECFYSRYTEEEAEMLIHAADSLELFVSAGSDYHGENKTVALGCLCADGYAPSIGQVTLLEHLGILI